MDQGTQKPPVAGLVGTILIASGVAAIIFGAILAVAVEPLLAALAIAGVIDIWLGIAWRRGTFPRPTQPGSDAAADPPELDPSYNPYARED